MNYGPKTVTNRVILALDAADKNSYPGYGTTWTDLSGNNNNGTLTNGPTFNSSNFGSLVFNGSNTYVNVANTNNLNASSQTINFWLLYTSVSGNGSSVVSKNDAVGSFNGYNLYLDTSGFIGCQFKYASGGGAGIVSYSTALSTNVWYNITLKFTSSSTMTLYVNANNVSSTAMSSFSISSQPLRIGRSLDTYWSAYAGRISNIQIYTRELSDADVRQNYNVMRGRFGL